MREVEGQLGFGVVASVGDETVDGEYRKYFVVNGVKHYIRRFNEEDEKDINHINGEGDWGHVLVGEIMETFNPSISLTKLVHLSCDPDIYEMEQRVRAMLKRRCISKEPTYHVLVCEYI